MNSKPGVSLNVSAGEMGFATRAPLAPPRSAQLPPDPFANFNQQLYPIPEGFQSFQAILRLIGMSQVLATAIATKATIFQNITHTPLSQPIYIFNYTHSLTMKCKHCGSPNTIKHGVVKLLKGDHQKYKCNDCRRTFITPIGDEQNE